MHITQGGFKAHILRRFVHVGMIAVPFIYYFFLRDYFSILCLHRMLLCVIIFVLLFERFRIKRRILLIGQRDHEAFHFSALGWTAISLSVVLVSQHSPTFVFPIIFSCALADPLMGEMRIRKIAHHWIMIAGLLVVGGVWLFFAHYYHFSYWYLLVVPLTVIVEWPSLPWIDDNALMLLVPLIIVMM